MDNAERLCDSVCIIARGEKVLDGGVAEVKAAHGGQHIALALERRRAHWRHRPCSRDTIARDARRRLRTASSSSSSRRARRRRGCSQRLVDAGAPITRFELVQPSLHQIFLETVGAEGVEEGMSGHG